MTLLQLVAVAVAAAAAAVTTIERTPFFGHAIYVRFTESLSFCKHFCTRRDVKQFRFIFSLRLVL